MKINILDSLPSKYHPFVHSHWYDHHQVTNGQEVEAVLVGVNPIDARLFPKAKWFICPCTNSDHIEFLGDDQRIIDLRDHTDFLDTITSTAEHTMCLILMLARRQFERDGTWNRYNYVGNVLRGKTLGIYGYGRVGKQVAKLASAFGMEIIPYDGKLSNNTRNDLILHSDFISMHASYKEPVINKTLDEADIANMKKGVFFINTSRHHAIDERLLLKHHTHFGGIALDVLKGEPSPLYYRQLKELDNVIITPHIAGCTIEDMQKTSKYCFNLFQARIT